MNLIRIPIKNVFRDDEVRDSYPKDKMLMNAPEKEDGCFKVPIDVFQKRGKR